MKYLPCCSKLIADGNERRQERQLRNPTAPAQAWDGSSLPDGWGEGWWGEKPPLFGVFLSTESLMVENTSKIKSNL